MIKKIGMYMIVLTTTIYANSYLSSATCSSTSYHELKNEINLDNINSKVAPYRAEAFVSLHIYNIDKTRDIGEEFQFGKNHVAKLLEYTVDEGSGFEAGLYKIDNKRFIIAFGGTTAQEKYSKKLALKNDAYADSVLLSNKTTSFQVNASVIFLQQMQVKYPNQDITATGHSLGGGLAQFASLMSKQYSSYKKIKAVTFNTAPMPLSSLTKKWVENLDENLKWAEANNINFMANNDPLTNILKSAENYDGSSDWEGLKYFHINTGITKLDDILNYTEIGQKLKRNLFYLAQIYLQQTVRDLKKLIYGKRIILTTNTGHPMFALLKKIAPNYANYGAFRHGFVDVPVGSEVYCDVLKLMKSHVISYPRSERDYKYYSNINTTNYEVSLYIVNNLFHKSYRNALENNDALSKFDYFIQKFSSVTGVFPGMSRNSSIHFNTFRAVMRKVYEIKITTYPVFSQVNKLDREKVLKQILEEIDMSIFGANRYLNSKSNEPITRMQMTKWIVESLSFNYSKLIKEKNDGVKSARLSKGSTDTLFKPYFLGFPQYIKRRVK